MPIFVIRLDEQTGNVFVLAGDNIAKLGRQDEFGQRYTLDFRLEWQNRSGFICSGSMIEGGFDIPKLTTCYPL